MSESAFADDLPWIRGPLQRALSLGSAHAVLLHGPSGVGQFETALALATAWLCENDTLPYAERPCGRCASCRLVQARSHPDLLVLVPEALREALGWTHGGETDEGVEKASKAKPSKEIRVEAIRAVVAFASTTSARGRAKVAVVHPAERMNAVAANTLLKTLEEPPGIARFVLGSAAVDALLPTIRSRCVAVAMPLPEADQALRWLAGRGLKDAAAVLAACGGQPQEAEQWHLLGIDGAACRAMPARVVAGDASGFKGWPLASVVDVLQKVCHDALAATCGAPPRYFPEAALPRADRVGLLAWSRELSRLARHVEHPWNAELAIESLMRQGAGALKTARSTAAPPTSGSLHSNA